ncbi:MAG: WecB/TagA/CpsF family glycosyltransferase [Hyphomicrobiales bacterium]
MAHNHSLKMSKPTEDDMINWPIRMLGGMAITVASRQQTANGFIEFAKEHRKSGKLPFYSTSSNGQVMAMCYDDADLEAEFAKADQISPDGMPMVFASKILPGTSLPERVATTDLFHDVAKLASENNVSFFLLGADENANAATFDNVKRMYPNLNIVGRRNGYFSHDEEPGIIAHINELKPDILWVSMGVPREQYFISRNIDSLTNVGVIKTSGGLFDFLSLRRSRAPNLMQSLGLEWAYRAILEPKRLGIRYALTNPKALKLLLTRS